MKKFAIMASMAALVLTTSCMKSKETQTTFRTNEQLEAVNVKVQKVQSREVDQIQEFTATVEADVVNNIAPQTPVRIRRINVEVGDRVGKGQTLVILDDNSLAQAKIQLDRAELEFSRYDELYKVGGISKSAWDTQKAQVDQQRRAYANLEENARLVSPISGVVTARNYDNGDLYNGQQPVLVVQKVNPVKLVLNVSETYFRNMKVGMPISDISLDAYPGETFTGKVSIIYPTVDSNTRTFPVEVIISNPNQRVRPGMFARVTLNFGSSNSVMVPDQAICKQTGSGERFVYVVNPDSTVTHKTIDLGRREGAEYVVNSGVESGATVVVFGQTLLTDGRKIHVLN
jgi:RND family efflux transporter MFP subunit